MEEFSFEKAAKFKKKDRYFNVNHLWAPGFMQAVRFLYYTPVRPELVVLASLCTGVLSAYLYSFDRYHLSIVAAILILAKNFLDNVDGHLARARGQVSKLGRFLDSLADAAVYICLFTGLAYNISEGRPTTGILFLSYIAMIMAFIQCSFYNYYLVTYKTYLEGEGVNKTDETFSEKDKKQYREGLGGLAVFLLQWIYVGVYGWQDKLVTAVDKYAFQKFSDKNPLLQKKEAEALWYKDKLSLTLFSPLCFGTQIFTLFVFTLLDQVSVFYYSLIIGWSFYAVLVFFLKINLLHKKN